MAKTEYAKHVARNIIFSEAAGQDNNTTGQTACEQVLYMGILGIWEVRDKEEAGGGVYTLARPPPLVSQLLEMVKQNTMATNLNQHNFLGIKNE